MGQVSLPVTTINTMLQLMWTVAGSNRIRVSLAALRLSKNVPVVVIFSALSVKPLHGASMKPVDLQPSKVTSNVPPLADVISPLPLSELHLIVLPDLVSSNPLPLLIVSLPEPGSNTGR